MPGDVVQRPVRVGRGGALTGRVYIAKDHLTVLLEPSDDVRLRVVVPFAVRDRNPQRTPRTSTRA